MEKYDFTEDWLSTHLSIIDSLLEREKPKKILEIGCFEGRSTTHFIERLKDIEDLRITCVDPWITYSELKEKNFSEIENRFLKNIEKATQDNKNAKVAVIKDKSLNVLSRFIIDQESPFDFIYVDGSHKASDVFLDAAMSFQLLRSGGLMIFDDFSNLYLPENFNKYDHPRIAICAFIEVHRDQIEPYTFDVINDGVFMKGLDGTKDFYQCYLKKK